MASVRKRRRPENEGEGERKRRTAQPDWLSVGIFAAIMVMAPLAFGAVDQWAQVGLLVLFAIGAALRPPELLNLARWQKIALGVLAGVLVVKEFAPASLFGKTAWREAMTRDFGLSFLWTHHPEPGRAVDGLFAAGLAIAWLLWVRTLAGRRENRIWLFWAMIGSAALVAAVSFLIPTKDPSLIFGLRATSGWYGFGPFPNRNHTACFLAMGVIASVGGLVWALVRQNYRLAGITLVLGGVSLAGVIATQSRGGVLALGGGLTVFAALCLRRFRSARTASLVAASALLIVAGVLATGGKFFARFSAPDSSLSTNTRRAIWHDALGMWKDAPLFGHGSGAFPSVFPLYETVPLDNQIVLHPESSWLQWLSELGLVPVLLAAVLGGAFVWQCGRGALSSRRSFFLYAAGLATAAGLLFHCAIDVPGHRWATAAFALAALGFACPRLSKTRDGDAENEAPLAPALVARRAALLPLAAAFFWSLPYWTGGPLWSPATLQNRLATKDVTIFEKYRLLEPELRWFPLNATLHQYIGIMRMYLGAPEAVWQQHLRLTNRLTPGSWSIPILFARVVETRRPELSFYYWQIAIERSGIRAGEYFGNARQATEKLPHAEEVWAAYVEANPQFALAYVVTLSEDRGRPIFEHWWRTRGAVRDTEIEPAEAAVFYQLAQRYSTPEKFSIFMQTHAALAAQDFRACARVLHGWGDDERAWQLLATRLKEPSMPAPSTGASRTELERRLRLTPDSAAGAQALAAACLADGDKAAANKVIEEFAARPDAPTFFTLKAGYLMHEEGRVKEAVAMMLKGK